MPIRTTAIEAAAARGWSKPELARRTGLSVSLIYQLADGAQPGAKAIAAIMRIFPDLPFERLFVSVPAISSKADTASSMTNDEPEVVAA